MKKRLLSAVFAAVFLLTACGQTVPPQSSGEDKLTIVCTTYPVYLFANAVTDSVDGVEVLRLRQVFGQQANNSQLIMRIALGGLLFPASDLRLPVTASQGQEP